MPSIIFNSSRLGNLRNPRFGYGLGTTCPATVQEARERYLSMTLSVEEYQDLQQELASIEEERMLAAMAADHDRYESQECAEIGAVPVVKAVKVQTEADKPSTGRSRRRRTNAAKGRRLAARSSVKGGA